MSKKKSNPNSESYEQKADIQNDIMAILDGMDESQLEALRNKLQRKPVINAVEKIP